jgi:ribosomal protein S1
LKQVGSAGYVVAVGAVTGFLPGSHVSGSISGNKDQIAAALLGEQVWVMILNHDKSTKNLVVSHRTVPSQYLYKPLGHQQYSEKVKN